MGKLVLHHEHEQLHAEPHAEAEHEQVQHWHPQRLVHLHARQQKQTHRAHDAHGHEHPLVAPGLRRHPAGGRRGDEDAHAGGRAHETGHLRRQIVHDLEVGGQVVERPHEADVQQKPRHRAQHEVAVAEEPHGDDGLGGAALQQHEDHSGGHS